MGSRWWFDHGPETEVLAARPDGLRNVLGLRGRQHKNDMVRRLFQCLQQGIEGGVGNLVRFVENINLEAVARGTVARGLTQFPDFVDAAIGGGVNLDYVDGVAGTNLRAGFADAARLRRPVYRLSLRKTGNSVPRPECAPRWFFQCRDGR